MTIIAYQNLADDAALTTDSELSTLPAANVQEEHVARKWRTGAVTDAYLVFDLGSSMAASVMAMLGTNLSEDATVRVRASDSDATGATGEIYDSGVIDAGVKSGFGAIYHLFDEVSARYWRIDLSDSSLTYIEAGRVFIGPRWTPALGVEFGSWSPFVEDPSQIRRSYGGQSYADVLPKRRGIQMTLNYLSDDEAFDSAHAMLMACGTTADVLVIPRETSGRNSEEAVWGLMEALDPILHKTIQTWSQKLLIKERL